MYNLCADMWKKVFCETPTCKWFIGGRVDGIQNSDTIVEVKIADTKR